MKRFCHEAASGLELRHMLVLVSACCPPFRSTRPQGPVSQSLDKCLPLHMLLCSLSESLLIFYP